MESFAFWPLAALFGLGAAHGINPGMGWLFAVALGLQEQKRSALARAVACLAAGHALAIAAVVLLAASVGLLLPLSALKWIVAALLIGLGVAQLVRHVHPRYGGLSVGPREVTIWSFLMATVHGAGLMALPLVMGVTDGGHAHHHGASLQAGVTTTQAAALLATVVHTAGYVIATGVIAALVYEKLGLRMLGRVWFNVRVIWAAALIVTGVLTPIVA
jgi:hypothetical protein